MMSHTQHPSTCESSSFHVNKFSGEVLRVLAFAYLRLLAQRHISPRVGHLAPPEDSGGPGQIGLDESPRPIAVQRLTGATTRPGEENAE